MGYINKAFALAIIISVAMATLIMIAPSLYAQVEIPTPSLPSCDVRLEGPYPKYVPPVYETDPSTGKTTMIKEGYTIEEKSLWVRLAPNQIFMPYNNSEGQTVNLFFNLRWKNHQDTVWQILYQVKANAPLFPCAQQEFPTSPVGLVGLSLGFIGSDFFGSANAQVPDVDQLDFQAEAFIGYYLMDSESYILDSEGVPIFGYALDSEGAPIFVGQSSGWCDIVMFDTIERTTTVIPGTSAPSSTLSDSHASPDPSDAKSDGLVGLNWETTILIIFAVIILAVAAITITLFISRKRCHNKKTDKWP